MSVPAGLEFKTATLDTPANQGGDLHRNGTAAMVATREGHGSEWSRRWQAKSPEFDLTDDPDGTFWAIVAVTGVKDDVDDIITPGAFRRTLRERPMKGVKGHDWNRSTAVQVKAMELLPGDPRLPDTLPDDVTPWPDAAGALLVKGRYILTTTDGREAWEETKAYDRQQAFSIGYKVTENGAKHRNGIRHISDLDVYEWSNVLHGAHRYATLAAVKDGADGVEHGDPRNAPRTGAAGGPADLCLADLWDAERKLALHWQAEQKSAERAADPEDPDDPAFTADGSPTLDEADDDLGFDGDDDEPADYPDDDEDDPDVKAGIDEDVETKIRRVHDSAYWGLPVGTPIKRGMKPQGKRKHGAARREAQGDRPTTRRGMAAADTLSRRRVSVGDAERFSPDEIHQAADRIGARGGRRNAKRSRALRSHAIVREHSDSNPDAKLVIDPRTGQAESADARELRQAGDVARDYSRTQRGRARDAKRTAKRDDRSVRREARRDRRTVKLANAQRFRREGSAGKKRRTERREASRERIAAEKDRLDADSTRVSGRRARKVADRIHEDDGREDEHTTGELRAAAAHLSASDDEGRRTRGRTLTARLDADRDEGKPNGRRKGPSDRDERDDPDRVEPDEGGDGGGDEGAPADDPGADVPDDEHAAPAASGDDREERADSAAFDADRASRRATETRDTARSARKRGEPDEDAERDADRAAFDADRAERASDTARSRAKAEHAPTHRASAGAKPLKGQRRTADDEPDLVEGHAEISDDDEAASQTVSTSRSAAVAKAMSQSTSPDDEAEKYTDEELRAASVQLRGSPNTSDKVLGRKLAERLNGGGAGQAGAPAKAGAGQAKDGQPMDIETAERFVALTEAKARNVIRVVRDAAYWGRPVGTPITPGMKPTGPRARAGARDRGGAQRSVATGQQGVTGGMGRAGLGGIHRDTADRIRERGNSAARRAKPAAPSKDEGRVWEARMTAWGRGVGIEPEMRKHRDIEHDRDQAELRDFTDRELDVALRQLSGAHADDEDQAGAARIREHQAERLRARGVEVRDDETPKEARVRAGSSGDVATARENIAATLARLTDRSRPYNSDDNTRVGNLRNANTGTALIASDDGRVIAYHRGYDDDRNRTDLGWAVLDTRNGDILAKSETDDDVHDYVDARAERISEREARDGSSGDDGAAALAEVPTGGVRGDSGRGAGGVLPGAERRGERGDPDAGGRVRGDGAAGGDVSGSSGQAGRGAGGRGVGGGSGTDLAGSGDARPGAGQRGGGGDEPGSDRGTGDGGGAGARPGDSGVLGRASGDGQGRDGGDAVTDPDSDAGLPAEGVTEDDTLPVDTSMAQRIAAIPDDAEAFRPGSMDDLAPAGARAKLDANLAALRTLRSLQGNEPQRAATPQEQAALARWAGWGSLPKVFEELDPTYARERDELRGLLSESEWNEARRNTLNAHYTDARVTEALWQAVTDLGFDGGRVLEPGSGSGNFVGFAPENAQMVGVEKDSTTAALSKYLYPGATIRNESFGDTKAPAGTFDAAVGNVPFGRYQVRDGQYNRDGKSIHNHFIVKSLALTRPGGVVAMLTSRYTMDSQDASAREEMAKYGDLIGAVRLPTGSHQRASGTDVIEDILIFRRREDGAEPADDSWTQSSPQDINGETIQVSDYFTAHPENVLGEVTAEPGRYGSGDMIVRGDRNMGGLTAALGGIVESARERDLMATPRDPDAAPPPDLLDADSARYEGHVQREADGSFTQAVGGVAVPFTVPESQRDEVGRLVAIKDTLGALLTEEGSHREETPRMTELRATLNAQYDGYVKKFGPVSRYGYNKAGARNAPGGPRTYAKDPGSAMIRALEENFITDGTTDGKGGTVDKAAIFRTRSSAPRELATTADNPQDAINLSIDTYGEVNLPGIAQMLGTDEADARRRLGNLVHEVPPMSVEEETRLVERERAIRDGKDIDLDADDDLADSAAEAVSELRGTLVPAAEYRSGNVRRKLMIARAAARTDPRFEANVRALQEVIPAELGPTEIDGRLGAVWIPASDVAAFVQEILNDRYGRTRVRNVGGQWVVEAPDSGNLARSEWGTEDRPTPVLVEALLNQKQIKVTRTPKGEKAYEDVEATIAAQDKAQQISERFQEWIWENEDRAKRLATDYNDRFNGIALRTYDDMPRTFPGMAWNGRKPRPHQVAAVNRIVSEPTALLGHVVGAGKTAEMAIGTAELKRLGMARKPAIIVPNHMLDQFTREYLEIYPSAKILSASSDDVAVVKGDASKRREFIARAATGDWDVVILTQNAFQSIPMSKDRVEAYVEGELAEMRNAMDEAKRQAAESGDKDSALDKSIKKMEQAIASAEAQLQKQVDIATDDAALTFEQTGIDYLMVDEAHHYSNLRTVSKIQSAGASGSGQATDLHMKLGYLRSTNESGRVATFATGTPIRNTVTQAYIMMRYLRPDLLQEAGINTFDEWAATFGEVVTEMELKVDSGGFKQTTRLSKFRNVPELLRIFHTFADIKLAEDLKLPTPDLSGGKPELISVTPSDAAAAYILNLAARTEDVKNKVVKPEEDNMLKISMDGRKAALSPALVRDPETDEQMDHEPGKVEAAADQIQSIHETNKNNEYPLDPKNPEAGMSPNKGGMQIVFLDMGTPKSAKDQETAEEEGAPFFDAYEKLRSELVARGMDASRIRFMHEAKNDKQKAEMFAAARSGAIDVLVGSTERMGVGTNVQLRATALHHIDAPWRPSDVEQREGRIMRQGNGNPNVRILRYVTKGSFDAYMWQTLERKAKFINQIMKGDLDVREIEDVGDTSLNFAEVKAIATGNPDLLTKAKTDTLRHRLEKLERTHQRTQTNMRNQVGTYTAAIGVLDADVERYADAIDKRTPGGSLFIGGEEFAKRADAGEALKISIATAHRNTRWRETAEVPIAEFGGHRIVMRRVHKISGDQYEIGMAGVPGSMSSFAIHDYDGVNGVGLIVRAENFLANMETRRDAAAERADYLRSEIALMAPKIGQTFPKERELRAAQAKSARLQAKMELDGNRTAAKISKADAQEIADKLAAGADPEQTPNARLAYNPSIETDVDDDPILGRDEESTGIGEEPTTADVTRAARAEGLTEPATSSVREVTSPTGTVDDGATERPRPQIRAAVLDVAHQDATAALDDGDRAGLTRALARMGVDENEGRDELAAQLMTVGEDEQRRLLDSIETAHVADADAADAEQNQRGRALLRETERTAPREPDAEITPDEIAAADGPPPSEGMTTLRRAQLIHLAQDRAPEAARRFGEPEPDGPADVAARLAPLLDGDDTDREWLAEYLTGRPDLLTADPLTADELNARQAERAKTGLAIAGQAHTAMLDGDYTEAERLIDAAERENPARPGGYDAMRNIVANERARLDAEANPDPAPSAAPAPARDDADPVDTGAVDVATPSVTPDVPTPDAIRSRTNRVNQAAEQAGGATGVARRVTNGTVHEFIVPDDDEAAERISEAVRGLGWSGLVVADTGKRMPSAAFGPRVRGGQQSTGPGRILAARVPDIGPDGTPLRTFDDEGGATREITRDTGTSGRLTANGEATPAALYEAMNLRAPDPAVRASEAAPGDTPRVGDLVWAPAQGKMRGAVVTHISRNGKITYEFSNPTSMQREHERVATGAGNVRAAGGPDAYREQRAADRDRWLESHSGYLRAVSMERYQEANQRNGDLYDRTTEEHIASHQLGDPRQAHPGSVKRTESAAAVVVVPGQRGDEPTPQAAVPAAAPAAGDDEITPADLRDVSPDAAAVSAAAPARVEAAKAVLFPPRERSGNRPSVFERQDAAARYTEAELQAALDAGPTSGVDRVDAESYVRLLRQQLDGGTDGGGELDASTLDRAALTARADDARARRDAMLASGYPADAMGVLVADALADRYDALAATHTDPLRPHRDDFTPSVDPTPVAVDKPRTKRGSHPQYESTPCHKCGGTGNVGYGPHGGVCYRCSGRGKLDTTKGAAARSAYETARARNLAIPAVEAQPGDRIRVTTPGLQEVIGTVTGVETRPGSAFTSGRGEAGVIALPMQAQRNGFRLQDNGDGTYADRFPDQVTVSATYTDANGAEQRSGVTNRLDPGNAPPMVQIIERERRRAALREVANHPGVVSMPADVDDAPPEPTGPAERAARLAAYTEAEREAAAGEARARTSRFNQGSGGYDVTVGGYVAGRVAKDADGKWTATVDEGATLPERFDSRDAAVRALGRSDTGVSHYRAAAAEGTFGDPIRQQERERVAAMTAALDEADGGTPDAADVAAPEPEAPAAPAGQTDELAELQAQSDAGTLDGRGQMRLGRLQDRARQDALEAEVGDDLQTRLDAARAAAGKLYRTRKRQPDQYREAIQEQFDLEAIQQRRLQVQRDARDRGETVTPTPEPTPEPEAPAARVAPVLDGGELARQQAVAGYIVRNSTGLAPDGAATRVDDERLPDGVTMYRVRVTSGGQRYYRFVTFAPDGRIIDEGTDQREAVNRADTIMRRGGPNGDDGHLPNELRPGSSWRPAEPEPEAEPAAEPITAADVDATRIDPSAPARVERVDPSTSGRFRLPNSGAGRGARRAWEQLGRYVEDDGWIDVTDVPSARQEAIDLRGQARTAQERNDAQHLLNHLDRGPTPAPVEAAPDPNRGTLRTDGGINYSLIVRQVASYQRDQNLRQLTDAELNAVERQGGARGGIAEDVRIERIRRRRSPDELRAQADRDEAGVRARASGPGMSPPRERDLRVAAQLRDRADDYEARDAAGIGRTDFTALPFGERPAAPAPAEITPEEIADAGLGDGRDSDDPSRYPNAVTMAMPRGALGEVAANEMTVKLDEVLSGNPGEDDFNGAYFDRAARTLRVHDKAAFLAFLDSEAEIHGGNLRHPDGTPIRGLSPEDRRMHRSREQAIAALQRQARQLPDITSEQARGEQAAPEPTPTPDVPAAAVPEPETPEAPEVPTEAPDVAAVEVDDRADLFGPPAFVNSYGTVSGDYPTLTADKLRVGDYVMWNDHDGGVITAIGPPARGLIEFSYGRTSRRKKPNTVVPVINIGGDSTSDLSRAGDDPIARANVLDPYIDGITNDSASTPIPRNLQAAIDARRAERDAGAGAYPAADPGLVSLADDDLDALRRDYQNPRSSAAGTEGLRRSRIRRARALAEENGTPPPHIADDPDAPATPAAPPVPEAPAAPDHAALARRGFDAHMSDARRGDLESALSEAGSAAPAVDAEYVYNGQGLRPGANTTDRLNEVFDRLNPDTGDGAAAEPPAHAAPPVGGATRVQLDVADPRQGEVMRVLEQRNLVTVVDGRGGVIDVGSPRGARAELDRLLRDDRNGGQMQAVQGVLRAFDRAGVPDPRSEDDPTPIEEQTRQAAEAVTPEERAAAVAANSDLPSERLLGRQVGRSSVTRERQLQRDGYLTAPRLDEADLAGMTDAQLTELADDISAEGRLLSEYGKGPGNAAFDNRVERLRTIEAVQAGRRAGTHTFDDPDAEYVPEPLTPGQARISLDPDRVSGDDDYAAMRDVLDRAVREVPGVDYDDDGGAIDPDEADTVTVDNPAALGRWIGAQLDGAAVGDPGNRGLLALSGQLGTAERGPNPDQGSLFDDDTDITPEALADAGVTDVPDADELTAMPSEGPGMWSGEPGAATGATGDRGDGSDLEGFRLDEAPTPDADEPDGPRTMSDDEIRAAVAGLGPQALTALQNASYRDDLSVSAGIAPGSRYGRMSYLHQPAPRGYTVARGHMTSVGARLGRAGFLLDLPGASGRPELGEQHPYVRGESTRVYPLNADGIRAAELARGADTTDAPPAVQDEDYGSAAAAYDAADAPDVTPEPAAAPEPEPTPAPAAAAPAAPAEPYTGEPIDMGRLDGPQAAVLDRLLGDDGQPDGGEVDGRSLTVSDPDAFDTWLQGHIDTIDNGDGGQGRSQDRKDRRALVRLQTALDGEREARDDSGAEPESLPQEDLSMGAAREPEADETEAEAEREPEPEAEREPAAEREPEPEAEPEEDEDYGAAAAAYDAADEPEPEPADEGAEITPEELADADLGDGETAPDDGGGLPEFDDMGVPADEPAPADEAAPEGEPEGEPAPEDEGAPFDEADADLPPEDLPDDEADQFGPPDAGLGAPDAPIDDADPLSEPETEIAADEVADALDEAQAAEADALGLVEADDGELEVTEEVAQRQTRVSGLLNRAGKGELDPAALADSELTDGRRDLVDELRLQEAIRRRENQQRRERRAAQVADPNAPAQPEPADQAAPEAPEAEQAPADVPEPAESAEPAKPARKPGLAGAVEDLADAIESGDDVEATAAAGRARSSLRRSGGDTDLHVQLGAALDRLAAGEQVDADDLRGLADQLRAAARAKRNERARARRLAKRLEREKLRSLIGQYDAELRNRNQDPRDYGGPVPAATPDDDGGPDSGGPGVGAGQGDGDGGGPAEDVGTAPAPGEPNEGAGQGAADEAERESAVPVTFDRADPDGPNGQARTTELVDGLTGQPWRLFGSPDRLFAGLDGEARDRHEAAARAALADVVDRYGPMVRRMPNERHEQARRSAQTRARRMKSGSDADMASLTFHELIPKAQQPEYVKALQAAVADYKRRAAGRRRSGPAGQSRNTSEGSA